jgi:CubicO group peptidase (beta-lactamase class C family)
MRVPRRRGVDTVPPMTGGDELRDLAVESFNEHTLAGLALGVVRDGRLDRFVGLGLADAKTRRPVDRDTVFRVGSISKTMTAIGVLQLVEEGRVALDDPVAEHVRAIQLRQRAGDAPITIRHLLTHAGGIGELRRWSDAARPVGGLGARVDRPLPDLTDYYAGGLRAGVAPGTKWAYANHGFALLGRLVEELRGEPFADVMRARIFDPLGMEHTDFARSDRVRDRLAVGYALRGRRMKPVKDLEVAPAPAGACYSSTADMARYAAAVAGGGAPLLRPDTLELMLAPQDVPGDRVPGMGLAFFLDRVGGHRVAGHDGGWLGFVSSMLVAPDDGLAVVAFTNTATAIAPHVLAERVLRRLLDVPEATDPVVPDDPHLWRELVGVYRPARGLNTNVRVLPLIGGELQVTVARGHLTARAASPLKPLRKGLRLRAADADDPLAFEVHYEDVRIPVAFERDDRGRVAALRAGSALGGFVRLHRRPRVTSLRLWGRAAAAGAVGASGAAAIRWLRRR